MDYYATSNQLTQYSPPQAWQWAQPHSYQAYPARRSIISTIAIGIAVAYLVIHVALAVAFIWFFGWPF